MSEYEPKTKINIIVNVLGILMEMVEYFGCF